MEKQLIEKLELVFDTDVELDVYNLGLIYELVLDEEGTCKVVMTFTDTACDCAESLPIEIVARLKEIDGIEDVKVEVTWSPAWKITRISRYGRIALACHRDKSIKLTLQIRKVSFFISYCLPDCSIFQKSVTAPREAEDTVWAYLPRTPRLYSGGKVVSAFRLANSSSETCMVISLVS